MVGKGGLDNPRQGFPLVVVVLVGGFSGELADQVGKNAGLCRVRMRSMTRKLKLVSGLFW